MLGSPRLTVAAVVLALITLGGCGGDTIDDDEWLHHQLPEDISALGSGPTNAFGEEFCDQLSDWSDEVRDHPHPEDPLLSDGWDAFLDVVDEIAETCPTDPSQMTPLLRRYGGALRALTSRIQTQAGQTQ